MSFVIPAPPVVSIPVQGDDARFPVHRVYCVGRNYAAHAVEMGGDPDREPPFFFQKNVDNLLLDNADFPYPSRSSNVHHEVELLVALGKGGRDIDMAAATACIFGYAVAIDMTRRDLQDQCKKSGRSWEPAKAFEHSAPCGTLRPASLIGHPAKGAIRLAVDGEQRQEGDLEQMIWKVPEMIVYLSGLFELAPGDVILTGTPSGVGPVRRGQTLAATIEGVGGIRHKVV